MMKRFLNRCFWIAVVVVGEVSQGFSQTFVAVSNRAQGNLGTVADNLNEATGLFTSVLHGLFYVIGMVFIFGGCIRFYEHRKNPSQTPISRVVLLLVAGIVIVSFPFVIHYLGEKFAQAG